MLKRRRIEPTTNHTPQAVIYEDEILRTILSYIPVGRLFRWRRISRRWKRLCDERISKLGIIVSNRLPFGVDIRDKTVHDPLTYYSEGFIFPESGRTYCIHQYHCMPYAPSSQHRVEISLAALHRDKLAIKKKMRAEHENNLPCPTLEKSDVQRFCDYVKIANK